MIERNTKREKKINEESEKETYINDRNKEDRNVMNGEKREGTMERKLNEETNFL
jgi:hypothetical protein